MVSGENAMPGFCPPSATVLGFPLLRADRPAGWPAAAKRGEDLLLGALLLLLFLLPMLALALWIRLDSPGPALFRQRRIGLNGRVFQVLKFRTMYREFSQPATCEQARRCDPRVTRAGAWLRWLSLDELPQLINVLRGEMSLVGPRPHAPGTCAAGRPFEQVVIGYNARHRVRPGMTGLAQVRGWRGETDTEDKILRRVQCDLEYIEEWSLWADFRILAQTARALASPQNAY